MRRPYKPVLQGNKPQLIREAIGDIEAGPDVRIGKEGSIILEFPYISIEGMEEGSLISEYLLLFTDYHLDEDCHTLYGYRRETEEEVIQRINREEKRMKQYEEELVSYREWLLQELEDINQ